ncbi:LysR family transcriptional regulator [Aureimonas sp. OT7]|uniref:LysR family transcriptional regulator n=1 Tax=Aureimonas sp. OT7 TaxID=2816454 RepID=UPI00177D6919|nr:LysR family transcriptional regulator [Aureimonas sp. OT7]QOG07274.1 LysR family transcriptional regulator [Aureimonas sp. OT7]
MIRPNLRHLDIFLSLCASGSVTTTARTLNLTQPAVSKAVSALEDVVQLRLFERRRNRLHLTADGIRIRDEAERLMNQVRFFSAEVEALQKSRRGEINILSIPSLAAGAIAGAIGDFSVSYPEINIRFGIGMSRQISTMVAQNRIDVGFIHGTSGLPEVTETFVAESEVWCLMTDGHPLCGLPKIRAEDLMGFPLIGFDVESPPSVQIREVFARAGLQPNVRAEINASLLAPHAVRDGTVAFVDPLSVPRSPNLVLKQFEPRIPLPIFILTHRNKTLSLPMLALCDTARHSIFRSLKKYGSRQ